MNEPLDVLDAFTLSWANEEDWKKHGDDNDFSGVIAFSERKYVYLFRYRVKDSLWKYFAEQ